MSQSSHDTNINLGKNIYQIVEITAFRAILAQRISILKGCLGCENTFTRTVSDCTLRFGFIAQMKRILCTKQSNLSLHF